MTRANIITIGDEILIGQITDTNSQWISSLLNEAGIRVERRLSVGDIREDILEALEFSTSRADVVIITGGLGPTRDDITKTTLAEFFGCGLAEDESVTAMVRGMLERRGVAFNELNRGQAYVPECCTVLPNVNGTAPGMWFEKDGAVLVSLPGVPFEMKPLMENLVIPKLKEHFSLDSIYHRTMLTYGLPESVLAETIGGWEDSLPEYMKLAYLPNPSGIKLRLSVYGKNGGNAPGEVVLRFAELEKIIPGYVVGYGDCTLYSSVASALAGHGKTLAVAESCTGGALSAAFTAMPGASTYFISGVTAYSNDEKVRLLGVSRRTLEKYGAVSRQVAEQMADGARRNSGANYAVSTTGIAGPGGGSPEKPVGTVCIALASSERVVSRKEVFGGLRAQNIERAVAAAADMLRRELYRLPPKK